MKRVFLIILMLFVMATPALAKTVNLLWDASPSPDVAGYKVCQSTSPTMLVEGQLAPTEGMVPQCTDVGMALELEILDLVDEIVYYYGVFAYNDVDQPSVLSNIVMSKGFTAPEPPVNNRGTSTVNNVPVPVQ